MQKNTRKLAIGAAFAGVMGAVALASGDTDVPLSDAYCALDGVAPYTVEIRSTEDNTIIHNGALARFDMDYQKGTCGYFDASSGEEAIYHMRPQTP